MKKDPKVSVVSICYNQERFIKEALEGFVSQKTDFDFEIIISDDSSNDRTQQVIEQYKNKYPDIIKPLLRSKNVGVVENLIEALKLAKGEYIALCEGDDYWTDDTKLQRQVDFLDKNLDYTLCFHPVKVFYEDGKEKDYIYPDPEKKHIFNKNELLKRNFIQTNSVMYRKQKYNSVAKNVLPLDWYLHLYHAQFGKIGFINRPMSVYRRHPGGVWYGVDSNREKILKKHGLSLLAMYDELFHIYTDEESRKIIQKHVDILLVGLVELDEGNREKLIKEAFNKFPKHIESFLVMENKNLKERALAIEKLQKELLQKQQQLESLKASKFWKLRNFIVRFMGKKQI